MIKMTRIPGFFFTFLLSVFYLYAPISYSADYDFWAGELAKKQWQGEFLQQEYIKKLNTDDNIFKALVNLISNTGVDWRIRINGILLLGETGNPKAADVLMNLFYNSFSHSDCPAIKSNLAFALGNFNDDTRVVNALIEGMYDLEVQVREASVRSLRKIGNPIALPYLIDKLTDESLAVRINAVKAIALLGDKRAIPSLKNAIERDKDPVLANEIADALRLLLVDKAEAANLKAPKKF